MITTYNLQTDVRDPAAQRQDYIPGGRCEAFLNAITLLQFDIINLQEVPREGLQRLQQLSHQYHIIYRQHSEPRNLSVKKNDGLVILLRKARFDFTPNSEIEVNDAGNPNISLIVRAIEKSTQKSLVVFNSHVRGGPQRDVGEKQVAALIAKINEVAKPGEWVLGGGDYNGVKGENRIQAMLNAGFSLDPSPVDTITEPSTGRKIDHLFSKNLPMIQAGNQGANYNPANSDHYPLSARVDFLSAQPNTHLPVQQPQAAVQQVPQDPSTLFVHSQPQGSFREVVMRHFKNDPCKQVLDIILSQHARTIGFEEAVKNDFRIMLEAMTVSPELLAQAVQDLDKAFIQAKLERAQPHRVSTPTPAIQNRPVQTKPAAQIPVAAQTPAAANNAPVQPAPVAAQTPAAAINMPVQQAPVAAQMPAAAENRPIQPVASSPVQTPKKVLNTKQTQAPKKNGTFFRVLTAPFRWIKAALSWLLAKARALF